MQKLLVSKLLVLYRNQFETTSENGGFGVKKETKDKDNRCTVWFILLTEVC